MKKYYLYWIKAEHHSNPYLEGYIGCSCQPNVRFRSHTTDNTNAGSKQVKQYVKENGLNSVSLVILAEYQTEKEAKTAEAVYRPEQNIGWNKMQGGLVNPDCTGNVHSELTKQKRANSVSKTKQERQAKNPLIYQSKFKGMTNRWTDEQKELIGSYHKGKTISEAQKKILREKMSRGKSSQAKRIAIKDLETDVITIFYSMSQVQDYLPISQPALKSAKRDYLNSGKITTMKKRYQIVPEQGED